MKKVIVETRPVTYIKQQIIKSLGIITIYLSNIIFRNY